MLRLPCVGAPLLPQHARAAHAERQPCRLGLRRDLVVRATGSSGDSSEAFPTAMSLADAYTLLGLKEGTSYEVVLDTKNKLLSKFQGQTEKRMEIESAYDVILSQQLKARLSGSLPVSNRVRFADVAAPKRQAPSKPISMELPGGAIAIRQLTSQEALTQAGGIFGVLAAWTLVQGLTEPSAAAAANDVPGLQLALGTAATVYLLREHKKLGLAKAGGLAIAGLIVGTLIGSGIESWLRVDLAPLGSLNSPAIVVGEFALAGLAAVTFLLA